MECSEWASLLLCGKADGAAVTSCSSFVSRRILELINGDRLPFPKVARMVYFSLWLLCLKYSLESIQFVVGLLALGRQCFLPNGVSRTHMKHTEELRSVGPSR